MNWKLIALLSTLGLAMALATIFFLPADAEALCWLIVTAIAAAVLGSKLQSLYALHGFLVGLSFTFYNIAFRLIFFHHYFDTHPEDMEKIAHRFVEGHLHIKLIVFGLIAGTLYSMVLALFTWISSRIAKTP